MFEERIEIFVDEEGDRFIISMFFVPRGASPELGLEYTEGFFREGSQIRPLWICLNRGSECDTLRIGVGGEKVVGYTESFI